MSVPVWTWGDPIAPLEACLRRGGVLAIPTESSYGLAVDPRSRKGCNAILAIKRRPPGEPLPVVLDSAATAEDLGVSLTEPGFLEVATRWPAALSVVTPLTSPLPATGELDSLALRVPDHRLLRELLAQLGGALTATSANRTGEPAITSPEALQELLLGHDAIVVDDGVLSGGPPSTLVRWAAEGFEILRRGRVPFVPPQER